MVKVSNRLIFKHLQEPLVRRGFQLLERDMEVQTYLRMSNSMVVERMNFNDHGPVHARISAGAALEIFNLLTDRIEPSTVMSGFAEMEDAQLVVLFGSYLHDIGNLIHRINHFIHSCYLANPILDRMLFEIYPREIEKAFRLKSEILHAIYSHEEEIPCLSVEAGAAKVADGMDMAEGRARLPYRMGKTDIHSVSAMAIKGVELEAGKDKAVRIQVHLSNPAGIFQIEEVLLKKIISSGISDQIEVIAMENGEEIKTIFLE
jgi:hypothetical protein